MHPIKLNIILNCEKTMTKIGTKVLLPSNIVGKNFYKHPNICPAVAGPARSAATTLF